MDLLPYFVLCSFHPLYHFYFNSIWRPLRLSCSCFLLALDEPLKSYFLVNLGPVKQCLPRLLGGANLSDFPGAASLEKQALYGGSENWRERTGDEEQQKKKAKQLDYIMQGIYS